MRREHKICVLIGIIAACLSNMLFVLVGLFVGIDFPDFYFLFNLMFGIALITGGLIITLADEKGKKPKDEKKQ